MKVEPPEGDTTRRLGPARHPGMAAFFLACNRNKRRIVLDLKHKAGGKALLRLAETAVVALGRRLAGILYALLRDGTVYTSPRR